MKRYIRKNKTAPKRPRGRPSGYRPGYAEIAKELCLGGATNEELAHAFQVTTFTIRYWAANNPDFSDALRVGKEVFDAKIERSLAERALGYTFDSEEIHVTRQGQVIRTKTKKHVPPDTTAIIFWLKNRDRKHWRDVNRYEHTGEDGKPIEIKNAREQLASKLAAMAARLKDDPGKDGARTSRTSSA